MRGDLICGEIRIWYPERKQGNGSVSTATEGEDGMREEQKKAKVYFTNFRSTAYGESIPEKMVRLIRKAGIETLDFRDKFTAIKMHCGEAGNMAYLRPQYARALADLIRALGGYPFLTDCNTLYAGSRKNALEHLETAELNGFNALSAGCRILIGDGLKGNDEVEVPVPNGVHCRTAKIGRAVMDADILISLTHFKGHEKMGIGGAVKNVGMGCGSRAGKMEMHSDGKPILNSERCVGCGLCRKHCAHGALTLNGRKMEIDHARCAGCGSCISVCPRDALSPRWGQSNRLLDEKTAEYAAAVLQGRPHFHISFLCDISPNCDCHGENDTPILPDIGMAASFDPVALDAASVDLCNKTGRLRGTWMDECGHGKDIFDDAHPDTRWRDTLDHAVRLGLGTDRYELITMK